MRKAQLRLTRKSYAREEEGMVGQCSRRRSYSMRPEQGGREGRKDRERESVGKQRRCQAEDKVFVLGLLNIILYGVYKIPTSSGGATQKLIIFFLVLLVHSPMVCYPGFLTSLKGQERRGGEGRGCDDTCCCC